MGREGGLPASIYVTMCRTQLICSLLENADCFQAVAAAPSLKAAQVDLLFGGWDTAPKHSDTLRSTKKFICLINSCILLFRSEGFCSLGEVNVECKI